MIKRDLLTKFETILINYFNQNNDPKLPTVENLAKQLNVSTAYLSDMLRNLTGQNTQQHIHEKLIEKAKEILINTDFTVSEI
jgi:AraC family transcriptional activator of pobA